MSNLCIRGLSLRQRISRLPLTAVPGSMRRFVKLDELCLVRTANNGILGSDVIIYSIMCHLPFKPRV